ncbi:LIM zinc-binding domain-containing Nebulette-like [Tubulanus polymorphus]|uniref:LIM zinc-binding domain-containing Nebulette-like n=1 Tax=Tubulanus polymorphus TaxID=672921 RepID=UPI003DA6710D
MNPSCHRCEKTVYPVEKLMCLDKNWHKACFKCEVCNMTLTMKTYKGYKKLPYCNTHYPTTHFTAVADTPENRRLAKNTKDQSSIQYHVDFEKEKGKYTAVSDDPETLRIKKSQAQASELAYKTKTQTPSQRQDNAPPPAAMPPPQPGPTPSPQVSAADGQARYVALYDYAAADDDEVSFDEGDFIINAEIIDDGWMTGTVERTGETGMLPANYVEKS